MAKRKPATATEDAPIVQVTVAPQPRTLADVAESIEWYESSFREEYAREIALLARRLESTGDVAATIADHAARLAQLEGMIEARKAAVGWLRDGRRAGDARSGLAAAVAGIRWQIETMVSSARWAHASGNAVKDALTMARETASLKQWYSVAKELDGFLDRDKFTLIEGEGTAGEPAGGAP